MSKTAPVPAPQLVVPGPVRKPSETILVASGPGGRPTAFHMTGNRRRRSRGTAGVVGIVPAVVRREATVSPVMSRQGSATLDRIPRRRRRADRRTATSALAFVRWNGGATPSPAASPTVARPRRQSTISIVMSRQGSAVEEYEPSREPGRLDMTADAREIEGDRHLEAEEPHEKPPLPNHEPFVSAVFGPVASRPDAESDGAPACSACMADLPIGGVDLMCPAGLHTLCLECATNMARAACDKRERAVCGFCDASTDISARVFSTSQLARAGVPSEVTSTHRDIERRAALIEGGGIVARCPTANCGSVHEVQPGRTELPVLCGQCDGEPFCPRCGAQPFHYRHSCAEFRSAKAQMPTLVALARGDRRRADAEWEVVARNEKALAKDSSTRCCPHCRAPFIRISGCNSMNCGNPGCGRPFDYTDARRYESQAPARPADTFERNDRGFQPFGTVCAGCAMAPIEGTRFRCMNCADDVSFCRLCFIHRNEAHGDGSHVFIALVAPAVVADNERRERRRREKAEGGCCIVA